MSKLAPLAALIAIACLAAARSPSRAPRPTRRADRSTCAIQIANALPPDCTLAATAPPATPCAPNAAAPDALGTLVSLCQSPPRDDEPLVTELVSLSRRLLQGDLALAQATLGEIDGIASPSHMRNLCTLLLAFTEVPRAREVLRAEALSADDDQAALALESVKGFRQLKVDCADRELQNYWDDMLRSYEKQLHAPSWVPPFREGGRGVRGFRFRDISLAPPAEGEEGEEGGGGATIEEQVPSIEGSRREVLVAVAQAGASLAAREKAIAQLAEDPSAEDTLRALARGEGTPNPVKSALYGSMRLRPDDYDPLVREILGSHDPTYLATLCLPLVCSAGERGEDALSLLEGLVPLADTDAPLAQALMCPFGRGNSVRIVERIERIARSAESEALRHEALFALAVDLWHDDRTCDLERMVTLQRLSWAPPAGLAAEASLELLAWVKGRPASAPQMLDDAFLQRAGALAQMPAVPAWVRDQLSAALAARANAACGAQR